jgi:TPR repeat protein
MKYLILVVLVLILPICGVVAAQQAPASSSPQQNTAETTQPLPAAQDHVSAEAPPSSSVGATSASGFPGQRSITLNNDPVHLMREISEGLNKNDVHRLEKLAASGDATAATRVGCAYWVGVGVKRNTTTSVNWLSKAAEGGSGAAALLLGTIDAGQSGVPAD